MTDPNTDVQATPDADAAQDADSRDITALPTWAQDLIRETRKEAAANRIKAKQEAEQRARDEQTRLAQQQEWQKLAELTAAERDQLKPKAERSDTLEAFVRQTVETRVNGLPEQYRTLVPDYDDPVKTLAWLDANAGKLAVPRPPVTDAGARGDTVPLPKLTDQERQLAQMAGMTEQQYAEIKAKKNAPPQTPTFPSL